MSPRNAAPGRLVGAGNPSSIAATDPLDMPLRAFLARLAAPSAAADPDPWVDIRSDRWPWRRIVDGAERGECVVARVGRRLLMRRSELDAWIERHRIVPRAAEREAKPVPSRIAHMVPRGGS